MPIVLKKGEIAIKDRTTGEYDKTINVVAEQTTADMIEDIQDEGTTQIGLVEAKGESVMSDIPASYDDLNNIVAGSYDSTKTYSVGDYVRYYDGTHDKLYRCITDISTAEAWTSSHWTEVVMADEVSDLDRAFTTCIGNAILMNWSANHQYIKTNIESGININSPITTASNVRYIVAPCVEGDIFTVTATGGEASRAWAFITSDGDRIKVSDGSVAVTDIILIAPANAAYLIVNDTTLQGKVIVGDYVKNGTLKRHFTLLDSSNDLNNIVDMGLYRFVSNSLPVNAPKQYGGLIAVFGMENYVIQMFWSYNGQCYRFFSPLSQFWTEWDSYINPFVERSLLTNLDDLNSVTQMGVYRFTSDSMPANSPGFGGILAVFNQQNYIKQILWTSDGETSRYKSASLPWTEWNDGHSTKNEYLEGSNILEELTLAQGAIFSYNGQDYQEIANNRIKTSKYWSCPKEPISIRIMDSDKKLMVFKYKNDHTYIGSSGWRTSSDPYTVTGGCIRFVIAYIDDAAISPQDPITGVVGSYGITYDNIPTLYLTGDTSEMSKDNAVTLQYTFLGMSGSCTCKWQGQSSVRYAKKNYTLKFDSSFDGWAKWLEFIGGWKQSHNIATYTENSMHYTWGLSNGEIIRQSESDYTWGSRKKYVMKANWVDPSMARNVVCARLWAQVVRTRSPQNQNLLGSYNQGAIDGFPVQILMNENKMGIFAFTTPKAEDLFDMGDEEYSYILSGEINSGNTNIEKAGSWLSECQDSYLYDVSTPHAFAIEYPDVYGDDGQPTEEGTPTFNAIKASLNTAISSCLAAGETWETDCADYIDVDSVIDYYIFACCIGDHDGMAKNILYGTYDGTKWFMSAYDMDTTFGSNPYGSRWLDVVNDRNEFGVAAEYDRKTKTYTLALNRTKHRLFHLVHKYSREKLISRYHQLRATVLSDRNVWFELSNFVQDIPKNIYEQNEKRWPAMLGTTAANIHQYMEFYRLHCAYLDEEIAELEEDT